MRNAIAVAGLLSLCACNYLETDAQRGYSLGSLGPGGSNSVAFTTADVRMISQREHPVMHNNIVCTEPSPDVAKALATAAGLSAQGGNGAASGSLSLSGSSAEAIAELAGRSTALLGLRDGLYRACEAYANGIIGQDAYALVLSRYGQLMTTLFLSQDITGAAGAAGQAATASAVIQAAAGQQSPNGGANQKSPTSTSGNKATDAGGSGTGTRAVTLASADDTDLAAKPLLLAAGPPAPGAAQTSAANPPTAADAGSAGKQNTAPSSQTQPAPGAGVGAVPALALVRNNEDYIHEGILGAIIVACVNEHDPTRYRRPVAGSAVPPREAVNDWLAPICLRIGYNELAAQEAEAAKHPWPPVDPTLAAMQPTSASGKQPGTNAPAKAGDNTVKQLQLALQKSAATCPGANPGPADGIAGKDTIYAVIAYQKCRGLPINGETTDEKTLEDLGLKKPAPGA
jgi:hypothetical protein